MTPLWVLEKIELQADRSALVELSTSHPSYPDEKRVVKVSISEFRLGEIALALDNSAFLD